jgi:hypothetical protein
MNGISPTHAEPYGPYVVRILWTMSFGNKTYGPFESETEAMRWIVENIPERTLFEIEPLYDRVWPTAPVNRD